MAKRKTASKKITPIENAAAYNETPAINELKSEAQILYGIQAVQRLADAARNDPQFFHALVFDTENVLSRLDYLDRQARAALVAISPEQVVGHLVGEITGCDVTCNNETCARTCGPETCGRTVARTSLTIQEINRFTNSTRLKNRRGNFRGPSS